MPLHSVLVGTEPAPFVSLLDASSLKAPSFAVRADQLHTGAVPTDFFVDKLPGMAGGALGAAAGAGLGGKAMYHFMAKACFAPPACMQVKNCLTQAADKAFMAGAVAGGAASLAGNAASTLSTITDKVTGQGAGLLDEWTAGPFLALWKDEAAGRRRCARPGDLGDFLGSVPLQEAA